MKKKRTSKKHNCTGFKCFLFHEHGIICLFIIPFLGIAIAAILMVFLILSGFDGNAAATSENFAITADTVNCGGEHTSTSASYNLTDSLCEFAAGTSSSSSYTIDAGYEGQLDVPFITFSFSKNTISFGTLSTTAIKTDSLTTTVTTNAEGGYVSTIKSDGALRTAGGSNDINAVSDGTVTIGSEEYGVSTSGSDGQLNSTDTGISTSATTYASNTFAANSTTTLTFEAAISGVTPGGSYSQIVYLVTTGTF